MSNIINSCIVYNDLPIEYITNYSDYPVNIALQKAKKFAVENYAKIIFKCDYIEFIVLPNSNVNELISEYDDLILKTPMIYQNRMFDNIQLGPFKKNINIQHNILPTYSTYALEYNNVPSNYIPERLLRQLILAF